MPYADSLLVTVVEAVANGRPFLLGASSNLTNLTQNPWIRRYSCNSG
jgi:hypothetical protein